MALSFPTSPTAGDQYVGDGVTYQYDGTLSAWVKLSAVQSALVGAAAQTGAAIIPGGDDAERAAITTPAAGMFRYNDQAAPAVMEYYDGTQWVDLATAGGGGLAVGDWTLTRIPGMINVRNVAYGNNLFVAVGQSSNATFNNYVISTSSDGYTWSTTTPQPAGFVRILAITFANGNFIIGNDSGSTAISTTGTAWTVGASMGQIPNILAGGNGRYVAASSAGAGVFYSTDGLNWTASVGATGGGGLAYGPTNEFLVWGGTLSTLGGTLYKSTNGGANFTAVATNWAADNASASCITYDGTEWIIATASGIYSSVTGSSPVLKRGTNITGNQSSNVWMTSTGGKTFLQAAQDAGGSPAFTFGTPIQGTSDSFTTSVASAAGFGGGNRYCLATNGSLLVAGAGSQGIATAKIL